jgi:hypothetical protein
MSIIYNELDRMWWKSGCGLYKGRPAILYLTGRVDENKKIFILTV